MLAQSIRMYFMRIKLLTLLLEATIILSSHFDPSIYQSSHSTIQVAERPEERWHTTQRCHN